MHPDETTAPDAWTVDALKRYPILKFFAFEHLPAHLQAPSRACHAMAFNAVRVADDGLNGNAELAAGLRKLVEAKDCFVRASIA